MLFIHIYVFISLNLEILEVFAKTSFVSSLDLCIYDHILSADS